MIVTAIYDHACTFPGGSTWISGAAAGIISWVGESSGDDGELGRLKVVLVRLVKVPQKPLVPVGPFRVIMLAVAC